MKTNCFVGDRRSPVSSALAVFECSNVWSKLQPTKIIPEGFYFIAGLLPHNLRRKADVVPNIFVQGYRPHSENCLFASEQRSYGALWVGEMEEEKLRKDDICLMEANVYQVVGNGCFRLVLMNLEWREHTNASVFMDGLREEHKLLATSDIKMLRYHCDKSRGYFLAGRDYDVWAQLVGQVENTQELTKKVLIVDYNCGLPCVVDFNEDNFELLE